jgi:hypothetical protein
MVTWCLARRHRRHRSSSLFFSPPHQRRARWIGLAAVLLAGVALAFPAREALDALLFDLGRTTVSEWFSPRALAVIMIVGVFIGLAALVKWGGGRALTLAMGDRKVRKSAACSVDFGPGLKSRPRLES